ncbi:MAG: 50S ribosomal protein L29 [archaeon]|nr:50S ribosomal protein L29 [archaeon]
MVKENAPATLRKKTVPDLLVDLKKFREDLQQIRFTKSSGTAVQKIAKIKSLRKAIARSLTILREKKKEEVVGTLLKRYETKIGEDKKPQKNEIGSVKNLKVKMLPKDLRAKKTRAIRRRMTKYESKLVTLRQLKRKLNFPLRKFAVPSNQ